MEALTLDKPLRTATSLVKVQDGLAVGAYVVDLTIVDEAGEQASARIVFEIQDRIIVRPPIDVSPDVRPVVVNPVVTPVVTPVVNPVVVRPVVTPVTPAPAPAPTPRPRAPAKRPAAKKTKPSDPTE